MTKEEQPSDTAHSMEIYGKWHLQRMPVALHATPQTGVAQEDAEERYDLHLPHHLKKAQLSCSESPCHF